MTGLLPDPVRNAVIAHSTYSASQTFGVVALVVLVLLLIERQALAFTTPSKRTRTALLAFAVPLFFAVALTIAARVEVVVQ